MHARQTILAIVVLAVGATQAWDSRVLDAGLFVIALAAIAVFAPPSALFVSRDARVHAAAVAVATVMLLVAKLVSPIALPALGVVILPAVMAMFFVRRLNAPRPREA
jgi:hypothetical protein